MAHEVINLPPNEPVPGMVSASVGGSATWDTSKIITDDGKPVDNQYVEKLLRLLTEPLYSTWAPADGRTFKAWSDVGLFHTPCEPAWAPDMMLSMDVRTDVDITEPDNRSYFVWIIGKVPDVVVEVVSDRRGKEDTVKMAAYEKLRIPHYVIYDYRKKLSKTVLRVFSLKGEKYQESNLSVFPEVGLGLKLWKGRYEGEKATWLRWHHPDGSVVLSGGESSAAARQQATTAELQAVAARQQAEAARQQAEAARQQAEAACQQAEAACQQAEAARQELDIAGRERDSARREAEAARQQAAAAEQEKQRLLEKLRQLGVSE